MPDKPLPNYDLIQSITAYAQGDVANRSYQLPTNITTQSFHDQAKRDGIEVSLEVVQNTLERMIEEGYLLLSNKDTYVHHDSQKNFNKIQENYSNIVEIKEPSVNSETSEE